MSGTDPYSCVILLSSSQQPCQGKRDGLIHPRLELCQFYTGGNWDVETEVVFKRVEERESIKRKEKRQSYERLTEMQ